MGKAGAVIASDELFTLHAANKIIIAKNLSVNFI
jgi:hypothetical protein